MKILALLLTLGFIRSSYAQEQLSSKMAFDLFLSQTTLDRSDFVAEYMFDNNNAIYDKYWNDEFDFNSKINIQYDEIQQSLSSLGSSYVVVSKVEFGDYDFNSKSFKFKEINESTYFPVKRPASSISCKRCKSFTKIDLFFINTSGLTSFPIDEDKASLLVKQRKKSSGEVDRDAIVKVYFTLTGNHEVESRNNQYNVKLYGQISKVELFDYYGYNQKSGSGKLISSVSLNPETESSADSEMTVSSEDLEIAKLKSYINNSFVAGSLKIKLLEVIEAYKEE